MYSDRSFAEKVGRVVLAPFVALLVIVLLPVLIIAYPVVAIIILIKSDLPLGERLQLAFSWPVAVLGFNELLSLGGLDNPTLSRITRFFSR